MKRPLLLIIVSILSLFPINSAMGCTDILVTPGASKNGASMVSYSADSHILYGALYYLPSKDYPEGSMRIVREWDTGKIMGEIPEAKHTYSVIGNMNEHQLLIGESTWGGRLELMDSKGIIDYGSMMYIALQRAKTAREAIDVMTSLVEEYGYASEGESISIADTKEVWIMDIIGKGDGNKGAVWVARKIPDGAISAHANQARITTFPLNDPENCLYAKDVISVAREKGYFKGADKDFSFADAYNPLDFSGLRACEARVWSVFRLLDPKMEEYVDYAMGKNPDHKMPLWIIPTHKVDVAEIASIMRNHYEGTPMDMTKDIGAGGNVLPYRWRPMSFEVDGEKYVNERAIATQQTGWWYIGECRGNLPDPIGGVLWFGTDDSATSPLTPFYCCTNRVPEAYKVGNGHMTQWAESSFWIQNRVANFAYSNYNHIYPDIKRAMDRWENKCHAEQEAIDAAATILYNKDPKLAVDFLTDYSCNTATSLYNTWVELDKYLLIKFIDGNIKKEDSEGIFTDNGYNYNIPAGPDQPGYSEKWKRKVVEDNGEILKEVKWK